MEVIIFYFEKILGESSLSRDFISHTRPLKKKKKKFKCNAE